MTKCQTEVRRWHEFSIVESEVDGATVATEHTTVGVAEAERSDSVSTSGQWIVKDELDE